jgi:hypothetical protein
VWRGGGWEEGEGVEALRVRLSGVEILACVSPFALSVCVCASGVTSQKRSSIAFDTTGVPLVLQALSRRAAPKATTPATNSSAT